MIINLINQYEMLNGRRSGFQVNQLEISSWLSSCMQDKSKTSTQIHNDKMYSHVAADVVRTRN